MTETTKLRMEIELDIEIDKEEYPELTAKDVKDGIFLRDSDEIDGFELTTDIPGLDYLSDFFLKNGKILKQELVQTEEPQHEKEKEETLERITAEDLVEQAVYLANAPDGVTEEDKSEAMLGMLGANIVDESVYEETDYEKEVNESIVKEFTDFKSERTEGKTSEQVFEDAYEIHVKTELKNGICEEYLTTEVYKALYQKKGGILQALYDAYQEDPNASVTTNTDAREFVEKYCEQNFPKIMNGEEPALSMGG